MQLPKKIRKRDPKYLEWIRSLQCLTCNCSTLEKPSDPIEAHHVIPIGGGKTGAKTDDSRTVPLCTSAHRRYHSWGRAVFESEYALNLEAVIVNLNQKYARLHPATVRKERKRNPPVTFCVPKCIGCARKHPSTKRIVEGGKDFYRCKETNRLIEVPR